MITNEELRETFFSERIFTLAREAIPDGVTNSEARRTLSEVGIPPGVLNIIIINASIMHHIPNLSEIFARYEFSCPGHLAGLYKIAQFGAGSASLDGATGKVFLAIIDRPNLDPPLLSSSLGQFVEFLNVIERERQLFEEDDDLKLHERELERKLNMIDRSAMGRLSPWRAVVELTLDKSRW